tara:strand:+ start:481 stop:1212 length:732 start_codon:yes stop_codon:yes gene_type:complete
VSKTFGFSLIELLVSMALLSSVILIGSSAFRLFGQVWSGQLGNFDSRVEVARNSMLVQDVLDSLVPYVVYDELERPIIFFEGNRNGFIGVSSKSIYSPDSFSVPRFSVKQNRDLSFDVLFEEWAMSESVLISTQTQIDFSQPIILFKSVSSPLFEYFVQPVASGRESEFLTLSPARWVDGYNSSRSLGPPLKVRLTFDTKEGPYIIYSILSEQRPGLLSSYQGSRSKKIDAEERGIPDDNCYC